MKVSEAIDKSIKDTLGNYIFYNGEIISDNGDNGLIRVEIIDDFSNNVVMYINELEEVDTVFDKWADNGSGVFLVVFDDCGNGEIELIEVFVEDINVQNEYQYRGMYS